MRAMEVQELFEIVNFDEPKSKTLLLEIFEKVQLPGNMF